MRVLTLIAKTLGVLGLAYLVSAVTVVAVVAGLVVYYANNYEQLDEQTHIRAKQGYLASLEGYSGKTEQSPNIIFILFDDMGYGDIGAGADNSRGDIIKTPNLDRLASEGVSFNNFYSPASTCTPARVGFLTGRLPLRAGMPAVVHPSDSRAELIASKLSHPEYNLRLPAEEITLANILAAVGYRTGMVGKWHLGDKSPSLPTDMGFDEFFGSLYSNDMKPFALYRNEEIAVEAPVDQEKLSELYSNEVVSFIEENADNPFFLYFAHNFPHDPLHVRPSLAGLSDAGLYGDVLEEIDLDIGDLLDALERTGQRDNTLIFVSSDNGPWFLGRVGNLRGKKGNAFEGGMRVPFFVNWPDGLSHATLTQGMAMGTDLVPTVLDILGLPAPADRAIDGRSLLPMLRGETPTPHEYLYYFKAETLVAVRDERFKYRAPGKVIYAAAPMKIGGTEFGIGVSQKEWLFDLNADPLESYDTSTRYPDDLERLRKVFEAKRQEMMTNKRGWVSE